MAIDQQLIDILACPRCKDRLASIEGGKALLCDSCKSRYAIHNGVPFLTQEQASKRANNTRGTAQAFAHSSFQISQGPDAGLSFDLEHGTCKAIGRSSQDTEGTAVLHHVNLTIALDQSTKSLISNYISTQFKQAVRNESAQASKEWLGRFQRVPDLILHDSGLSHLHAMFFADATGRVGMLDLVSQNGTFVNGKEIESQLLKEGDVIELGETKIVFAG